MEPRIPYAKTKDGVSIAFWTLGEGEPLVHVPLVPYGHTTDMELVVTSMGVDHQHAIVDELPRNPLGKVLKTELRKLYGEARNG